MIAWFKRWWRDQQTYRQLQSIKAAVDARITYQNDFANKWTYVPAGTHFVGDCQAYAETYRVDAQHAGFDAYCHVYRLPDGVWHAVCVVDDVWILDCRSKSVTHA